MLGAGVVLVVLAKVPESATRTAKEVSRRLEHRDRDLRVFRILWYHRSPVRVDGGVSDPLREGRIGRSVDFLHVAIWSSGRVPSAVQSIPATVVIVRDVVQP